MTHTCWTGCSFTYGEGFDESDRDLYIYDRIVSRHMGWQHVNAARPGASNYLIFLSAAQNLLSGRFDKIFVQWSALNRVWFFPGPDSQYLVNDQYYPDFRYQDLYINSKDKKKLSDLILMLNHDFHNILQLIDYCCILEIMSKQTQCDVYFINGLVPWTADIKNATSYNLSEQLSPYTKSMLDFDLRDDTEILTFLTELQNKFVSMPCHLWINLFDSMSNRSVDRGPLGHHPGIQSHKQMADMIINFIQNNKGSTYA